MKIKEYIKSHLGTIVVGSMFSCLPVGFLILAISSTIRSCNKPHYPNMVESGEYVIYIVSGSDIYHANLDCPTVNKSLSKGVVSFLVGNRKVEKKNNNKSGAPSIFDYINEYELDIPDSYSPCALCTGKFVDARKK